VIFWIFKIEIVEFGNCKTQKTLNFHQFEKQLAQNKNPEILDAVKYIDLTFK